MNVYSISQLYMKDVRTLDVSTIFAWNIFLASSRFSINDLYSSPENTKMKVHEDASCIKVHQNLANETEPWEELLNFGK